MPIAGLLLPGFDMMTTRTELDIAPVGGPAADER
jgi:hypothetical protein